MPQPPMAPERALAIIDIDGVVADVEHRLHHIRQRPKNWDAFFAAAAEDRPLSEGVALVESLAAEHEIVFLTGRPRRLEGDTLDWLERHGLGGHPVEMRPDGDRRPAATVKVEVLRRLAAGRDVAVVVDDDDLVLEAMTAAGYRTHRADWGVRRPDDEQALRVAQEVEGRT